MNTKTPLAVATSALMLVALAACNNNDANRDDAMPAADTTMPATAGTDDMAPMDPTPATPAADTNAPMDLTGATQPELLAIVAAVDQNEIKAAEQAKSKNVTGAALEYANMMIADHGKNLTMANDLAGKNGGAPTDSARVTMVKNDGQAMLDRLNGMSGDDYARAYLQAMVEAHTKALAMLDAGMPMATDAAVKDFLTKTRDTVSAHRDRAQTLVSGMGGAGTAGDASAADMTGAPQQ